ncbi:MAG: SUMF1/EgtB/PvdO family nonheme iron enzyme, partial [Anaerolineae bacterium]|nr:SUMF1/EgtB/PvdO family nonheme iron enzyme [Anaerolineae bacterium]
VYTPPPDPRRFVTDLPPEVTAALLTMLAKVPAGRFPTAGAFVAQLWKAQLKPLLPGWFKLVSIGLTAVIVLVGVLGPPLRDAFFAAPTATLTPATICDAWGCSGDTWTRPQDGMMMVYVPGGMFQMGSTDAEIDAAFELCNQVSENCQHLEFENEQPVHTVTLDSFWLDQTEVTNEQYAKCVASSV